MRLRHKSALMVFMLGSSLILSTRSENQRITVEIIHTDH